MNKKIVFLTYIPSPYRVDFFNELSNFSNLLVVYYKHGIKNPGWKKEDKKHNYNHIFLFQKSKINGLLNLIKLFNLNKNEIIIVGGYGMLIEIFSILFLKFKKIDFVLNSDGGFINKGRLKTIVKKILIKSASYYLSSGVNSSRTLNHYGANNLKIHEYHFTSLSKIDLLNKILSDKILLELRKSYNLKPNICYGIFVGQLISRKGLDILVSAVSTISNKSMEFLIIGDGEQRIKLENLVDSLSLRSRIHFLGNKSKNEVLNYLRISDIFIAPSREDIWGLVVNEALSNGLALLVSDKVGSAYSLINQGKNGYLFENENVKQLSELIDLISSGDLKSMKQESINLSKHYTIEKMVKDHLNFFKKIKY